MINRHIAAIVLSLIVLNLPMPLFAIEVPEFELVEETDDVQIRQYPALTVARTRVSADFKKAGNEGFRRLGGYIFGDNVSEEKISMTAPVSQAPAGEGEYWVTFFMPGAYSLDTLPVPGDESVELTNLAPTVFAVWQYRGGWSENRYRQHEQQLLDWLAKQKGWEQSGPPVWSRYNSPFMPSFMRTNEVMVPIRAR